MTEAERLAQALDKLDVRTPANILNCSQAATLLRSQAAEIEALRADAERYRWLRDKASGSEWEDIGHGTSPQTTDAHIDAARQQSR